MRAADLLNLSSMTPRRILSDPDNVISEAQLSPDGSWIAFASGPRLMVARIRNEATPPGEWIEIDPAGAGSPAWSADGGVLYFRSRRDGFHCLWSQRLDASKRPSGAAVVAQHFHAAGLGIRLLEPSVFRLSVGAGRLFFNLAKSSSELWTTSTGP
jgi:Tol biopolymer transport system component